MKILAVIILFAFTGSGYCQTITHYAYKELDTANRSNCNNPEYFFKDTNTKKIKGKITIPVSGKRSVVFKDDVDPEMLQCKYLGDIKQTRIAIIQLLQPNDEFFCLINRSTGTVDTLIGMPVLSANMRYFACINNPGTDEEQKVQIGEIEKGIVRSKAIIKAPDEVLFDKILCVMGYAVILKDNNDRYRELNFTNK